MAYFPTIPDETAFTAGASPVTPIAGVFNDALAAVTSGESGSLRITEKRAAHVNLRSETGTELATASAPLRVDPTGTTKQPVTLFDSAGTAIVLSSGRLLVDGSGVTQPISGTVADSTLAAIITGGKAAVTDAAAEASLATIATNTAAAGTPAPTAVYSGSVVHPLLVANLMSTTLFSSTTPVTLITGAPGYFITGMTAQVNPAALVTTAGTAVLTLADSSSGTVWQFVFYCNSASPAGLVVAEAIPFAEQHTHPGFFWNNKVSNSTFTGTLSQAFTLGGINLRITYAQASFVG